MSITKAIIEHLGRFSLFLTKTEKEGYLTSLVKFRFGELILINNDGFVIQGDMETSRAMITMGIERMPHKSIQIQYLFQTKEFMEITFCSNGVIRRKNKLELISAGDVGQKNKAMADSLIFYVESTNK